MARPYLSPGVHRHRDGAHSDHRILVLVEAERPTAAEVRQNDALPTRDVRIWRKQEFTRSVTAEHFSVNFHPRKHFSGGVLGISTRGTVYS